MAAWSTSITVVQCLELGGGGGGGGGGWSDPTGDSGSVRMMILKCWFALINFRKHLTSAETE